MTTHDIPAFSCANCRETYQVLGETPIARARALRDWTGCPCTPKTPAAPTGEEAGAVGPSTKRRVLSRLLSGRPRWVERRWQTWAFDTTDLRAH